MDHVKPGIAVFLEETASALVMAATDPGQGRHHGFHDGLSILAPLP
jgi:hypothetical protein